MVRSSPLSTGLAHDIENFQNAGSGDPSKTRDIFGGLVKAWPSASQGREAAMVKILILGGGGMIGQKLARQLAETGWQGQPAEITAHDVSFPDRAVPVARQVRGDITELAQIRALVSERPDIVFHLASVVSGEAEEDFDKGWRVNMFPCWELLQALRAEHVASGGTYRARLVFTSSVAAFGAPFPHAIGDEFLTTPLTSYGAQKVVCEQLISDFSRKGFVDGVSLRLPTICVRPGLPNKAASGFFSGIIREPLNGQEAILPVSDQVRHTHASPRAAIGFLCHAAGLDTEALGGRRSLNMPGVSVTVAEQIEALREEAGESAVALIRAEPDPAIDRIVSNWPQRFDAARARALGFMGETDFREIIRIYVEDDLRP
jgi:nucleoside-diphosphate-sugar epimerase